MVDENPYAATTVDCLSERARLDIAYARNLIRGWIALGLSAPVSMIGAAALSEQIQANHTMLPMMGIPAMGFIAGYGVYTCLRSRDLYEQGLSDYFVRKASGQLVS